MSLMQIEMDKNNISMHHNDEWPLHHNEIVVQSQLLSGAPHGSCHITDEVRYSIIDTVRQMPGIWDSQREKISGAGRKELFGEVARQVSAQHQIDNPPLMAEEIEKQWKNLKDTFIKTRKKISYNSDGSVVPPKWKFYSLLTFLDNLNRKRPGTRYDEEDLMAPSLMQIKRIREDDLDEEDEYMGFCRSLVYHMRDIGQRDRIAYLKLAKQIRDIIHETQMNCLMGPMR